MRETGGVDSPRDSVRFVPFADDSLADPYPQYAALRAADPVQWSEKLRAWILFRYDDVATMLRDDVYFSADRGRASRAARPEQPAANLRTVSSDPPASLGRRAHQATDRGRVRIARDVRRDRP